MHDRTELNEDFILNRAELEISEPGITISIFPDSSPRFVASRDVAIHFSCIKIQLVHAQHKLVEVVLMEFAYEEFNGYNFNRDEGDEEFQVSLLGLAPMHLDLLSPRSPPLPLETVQHSFPHTSSPAKSSSFAVLFRKRFKDTRKVRSLTINSFGTFELSFDMELQYVGLYQPIPNGLCCSFSMYHEDWTSSIHYVLVEYDNANKDTVLEFTIRSKRTGQITALVETRQEANMRRKSKRAVLICNKVFDLAWQTLSGKSISTLDANGKGCRTNESSTLFGLKDNKMKKFVLDWYGVQDDDEEEQDEEER